MSEIRHLPAAPTQQTVYESGAVIDRHRHDDHQLIYVSTGVLAIRTARGDWVASRDRAVWVPAHTWHEHRFYGRTLFHTIGFAVGEPSWAASPAVIGAHGLLRELIVACTEPDLPPAESARLRAVIGDRLHRAAVHGLVLPTARDPRLADACRLVEHDLSRPCSLPWLARRVGTSERTLTRLFRTEFGTTYPQWRTAVRVFRAMVSLAEGATVTEAGHACGWATTSAFVDTFARTMGQTPGAYRSAATALPPHH
ncbi:MAG TPA: AraC family transcriptional regulator [Pseudonocardia sp.]